MTIKEFVKHIDNADMGQAYSPSTKAFHDDAWETAKKFQTLVNIKEGLVWKWDCNYKASFDCALVEFISWIYPPHKNTERKGWDVVCLIFYGEEIIHREDFIVDSLDDVVHEVRKKHEIFSKKVEKAIKGAFQKQQ